MCCVPPALVVAVDLEIPELTFDCPSLSQRIGLLWLGGQSRIFITASEVGRLQENCVLFAYPSRSICHGRRKEDKVRPISGNESYVSFPLGGDLLDAFTMLVELLPEAGELMVTIWYGPMDGPTLVPVFMECGNEAVTFAFSIVAPLLQHGGLL